MQGNAVVLSLVVILVRGSLCSPNIENNIVNDSAESSGRNYKYSSDLKSLYHTYQECNSAELSSCLKLKLIETVDRISRAKNEIRLVDGISFVKDSKNQEEDIQTVDDIKNNLPRSMDEKERALNNMLFDKLMSFIKGHTLQVCNRTRFFVQVK